MNALKTRYWKYFSPETFLQIFSQKHLCRIFLHYWPKQFFENPMIAQFSVANEPNVLRVFSSRASHHIKKRKKNSITSSSQLSLIKWISMSARRKSIIANSFMSYHSRNYCSRHTQVDSFFACFSCFPIATERSRMNSEMRVWRLVYGSSPSNFHLLDNYYYNERIKRHNFNEMNHKEKIWMGMKINFLKG